MQDGPLPTNNIVEAKGGALRVDHPRLRELPPNSTVPARGEETLGVGNPDQFLEAGLQTGRAGQRAQQVITKGCDEPVALGDDPADETGAACDLGDVWFTFGLVGVEQRFRRLSAEDGGELPAQVGSVANPGRHALADPRRHGVRGIPGQKYPPRPPPVGDADVVAIDHGPQDLDVSGGDALVAQDLPNLLITQKLLLVLVRACGKLPSVVAEWSRAVDHGAGRVRVEPQPVIGIPLVEDFGVDDDPSLGVGASGIADTELAPSR